MSDLISLITAIAGLAADNPIALLVALTVVAVVYQSWQLRKEREVNRLLVSEMIITKKLCGVEYSPRAEDTISARDRRVKEDPPTETDRRRPRSG